jgi:hypothetical protein
MMEQCDHGGRFSRNFLMDEVLDHFEDRSAEPRKKTRSNGTFDDIETA